MHTDTILNTESFDLRTQQALVFSLYDSLKAGSAFLVHLSSDPEGLCRQLDQLAQPDLEWEFVDKSPGNWKLRIRKRHNDEPKSTGGCCGMCGG